MREALWLCIDRLCHTPVWRDAETDIPDFHAYYTMDSSCKRRFQEAAEYLNKEQYIGELEGQLPRCYVQAAALGKDAGGLVS